MSSRPGRETEAGESEGGSSKTVHLHPDHDSCKRGGFGGGTPAEVQGTVDLRETVFLKNRERVEPLGYVMLLASWSSPFSSEGSGRRENRSPAPCAGNSRIPSVRNPEAPCRGPGRRDRNQNPEDPGPPEQADGVPGDPVHGRARVRGLHLVPEAACRSG